MTWNYRIVRYRDGKGFGLHEVYYDDETHQPNGRTVEPIISCDEEEGSVGIIKSLSQALRDARELPVLEDDFAKAPPPINPSGI